MFRKIKITLIGKMLFFVLHVKSYLIDLNLFTFEVDSNKNGEGYGNNVGKQLLLIDNNDHEWFAFVMHIFKVLPRLIMYNSLLQYKRGIN
jgi:hypothetical protein